jgi:hypothetical protein
MWAAGRIPMSFSHGDFTYDYLREVAVAADGSPRFPSVSWALHIDSTMAGRDGAKKPERESELHPFRVDACARFERLRREHGVRSYLAHNMTVTPANVDQVAEVVSVNATSGFRMFSFQPAAYVGNNRRCRRFRTVSDDQVGRGRGRRPIAPHADAVRRPARNRARGVFIGDRYVLETTTLTRPGRDLGTGLGAGCTSPGGPAVKVRRRWPGAPTRPDRDRLRDGSCDAGGLRDFRKGVRPSRS